MISKLNTLKMINIDDLTIFIIRSGTGPCFEHCHTAILKQTVKFNIIVIKDIAPMSKAFQQMLDLCKTKYYVEVDEDMVLDNNAIELMYNRIQQLGKNTAIAAFKLLDVHSDAIIYGVKIYNHTITSRYPYNLSSMSCEVEQNDRITKDGYRIELCDEVVGKHAPYWSNTGIFERYHNLMDKFKQFKYPWIEDLPKKLVDKFKAEPTDQNLYALLGIYTSLITDKVQQGEKDFRDRIPQVDEFNSYCNKPLSGNVYMTSKCNFACKFCYRITHKFQIPDVTLREVKDLVFRFPSIQSICLAGFGEPFLNKILFEAVTYCKSLQKYVGIVTNGSLLVDRIDEIRTARPGHISVSLNAGNNLQHQQISSTTLFNKVIRGIELCVSSNINTFCSYVCTKDNIDQVPEFLNLVESLGVKKVDLINLLPHQADTYNDDSFWNSVLTVDDEEQINYIKSLPQAKIIQSYPKLIKKGEVRYNCNSPWQTICIDGDSNLSFCSSVYAPGKEKGHIKDFNIWHNDYVTKLRRSFSNKCTSDQCKMCFRSLGDQQLQKDKVIENKNVENIVNQNVSNIEVTNQATKLKVCKIIDQFGWAYYFIAKEQQRYSKHELTYKRIIDAHDIDADVVYIHSPDLSFEKVNLLIHRLKEQNIKIIGGYGGEQELVYDYSDIIVSISIKHVDKLKKMYPNKPIVFFPELIDDQFFKPIELPKSGFMVGWAGSVRSVKRTYLLDKLHFQIVKQSEWGTSFFKEGRSHDKMLEFYNKIDVLVLTSSTECMPRVVLEAMACGVPVVSTDVGCIRLLIDSDWIIPVNPESIVVDEMNKRLGILERNKSLRLAVGKRNRQHIERFFSWSNNNDLWDRMFTYVADGDYESVIKMSNDFLNSIYTR